MSIKFTPLEELPKRRGKTKSKTVRIDTDIVSYLEMRAKVLNQSFSAIVNEAVKRFADWDKERTEKKSK